MGFFDTSKQSRIEVFGGSPNDSQFHQQNSNKVLCTLFINGNFTFIFWKHPYFIRVLPTFRNIYIVPEILIIFPES